jgi:hypothetical protein
MSVQNDINVSNIPFILSGVGLSRDDQVILTDAGRAAPLVPFTVMSKVAATGKWVPFTNEAATNGTAIPQGIYLGDAIAAADIVAGDVSDVFILVGKDVTVDVDQIIIENAKTLDTVITIGTTDLRTVRDHLATRGIFTEETVDISSFENA